MRHWRTIGNSNVAFQTGSTYISDSMTHIITILTANLGFSTRTSSQKVSTSDCNFERQPEIAIWPPKPEMLISLELRQLAWQFQLQIWSFRPRPARRNWPRAIATTTDNRKWQYRRFGRQSCNCWWLIVVAIIWLISFRARRHRKSGIWRWNFNASCRSSRYIIIFGFDGHIDMSGNSGFETTVIVRLWSREWCKLHRCDIFEC